MSSDNELRKALLLIVNAMTAHPEKTQWFKVIYEGFGEVELEITVHNIAPEEVKIYVPNNS